MSILGFAMLLGALLLCILFLRGMVWAFDKVFAWLVYAGVATFLICIFILSPLCIFRKSRPWAGLGYYIASFVFGILLFADSCLFAYSVWGYTGLFVGLVFAGVGVLPVALLAALLHAEWAVLGELLIFLILTFGARILGIRLATGHPTAEDVLTD
jgi:hypothetical protein